MHYSSLCPHCDTETTQCVCVYESVKYLPSQVLGQLQWVTLPCILLSCNIYMTAALLPSLLLSVSFSYQHITHAPLLPLLSFTVCLQSQPCVCSLFCFNSLTYSSWTFYPLFNLSVLLICPIFTPPIYNVLSVSHKSPLQTWLMIKNEISWFGRSVV